MGSIGGMLGLSGGVNGTGFSGPTATPIVGGTDATQLNNAYTGSQNSLASQQALLAAIQAQNGLGNQSQVYGQLQGVANGTGPNPAQAMLNQATGANVANQAALMAGQRGAGANAGLIARQAGMQGAGIQQNAVGQGATMQANQSLNALGAAGSMANQQAANQIGATNANTQANQSEQQILQNANANFNNANVNQQNNLNNINGGFTNTALQGQQSLVGGLIGSAGAVGTLFGGGSPKAEGGMIEAPKMAEGGMMPEPAVIPQSSMGQFLSGWSGGSGTVTPLEASAPNFSQSNPGADSITKGFTNLKSAPKQAAQAAPVAALSSGGSVGSKLRSGGPVPGQAKVPGNSYANDTVKAVLSPGEVVVPRSVMQSGDPAEAAKRFVQAVLAKKNAGSSPKRMADGGAVSYQEDSPEQIAQDASVSNPIEITPPIYTRQSYGQDIPGPAEGVYQQPQAPDQDAPPETNESQGLTSDNTLLGPANTKTPEQSDPYGVLAAQNDQLKGIQEVGSGKAAEEQVNAQKGADSAKQEGEYLKNINSGADAYHATLAQLDQDQAKFNADHNNGMIDTDRYLKNMSTGGKIMTAIGLILGGMGSGLTHGPNLAFNYLQGQIDKDIDAQKTDVNSHFNYNLQKYKNAKDAYEMTKLQSLTALESHLRTVSDQTADPLAKARIAQVNGMTLNQIAQLKHQIAITKAQQAAFNGNGQNTQIALESLPAEKRERVVQIPGGGIRLALTKDGAKEMREQIQSVQPIFDSLNRLQSLGTSALVPGTLAHQQAEAIRSQLIPLVNENAGLKRLSGEDIGNIKQMFTDPTKFSSILGNAKTASFKAFLQDKLMSTMGSQLEGGNGSPRASSGNFGFKPRKR